jgi:hypothetical protein
MYMPGKFALDFDEFYLLAIERCNDLGPPMVSEKCEFMSEIDFVGVGRIPSCQMSR